MRQVIKKNFSLIEIIGIISALKKIQLSDSESAMLSKLIKFSNNNSVTLDVNLSRQIRDELKMTQSSFNTAIHRLELKKCITKEGKGIVLNPVYNRISEWIEIVIKIFFGFD